MTTKQENKKLIAELHAQKTVSATISDIAKTTQKVEQKVEEKVQLKKQREVTLHSERKINFEDIDTIKDVIHKNYHMRSYQHFADDDHSSTTTVYFNSATQKYELLTKQIAVQQLVKLLKEVKAEFYSASQLITKHSSRGSAYGDIYRSAFDVLQALKIVKLDVDYQSETRRRRYSLIDSAKLSTL